MRWFIASADVFVFHTKIITAQFEKCFLGGQLPNNTKHPSVDAATQIYVTVIPQTEKQQRPI